MSKLNQYFFDNIEHEVETTVKQVWRTVVTQGYHPEAMDLFFRVQTTSPQVAGRTDYMQDTIRVPEDTEQNLVYNLVGTIISEHRRRVQGRVFP